MKRITVAAFILNVIIVSGHVTFSTKSDYVTTILPVYNTENGGDSKSVHIIQSPLKRFNLNDTRVYLDDVVFALKNQDWAKEEEPCLNRTLLWLKNLQNFTLWALWNWDSLSPEPQGVLYGSRYHLGNFDECMNPPWYKDHPEMRSQYCLADILIHGTDHPIKSNDYDPYQSALNLFKYKSSFLRTLDMLTWGVCVPDVCQPRSVERLVKIMLAHSHLGTTGMRVNISVTEECQKPDHGRPFDAQFYAFIGTALFLIGLSLLCTNLNHSRRDLDRNTLSEQFIGAFDLKLNAKTLIENKVQDLNILYGIKCITILVIVIGHQYGLLNGGAISNGLKVDEDVEGFYGMIFLHNDVAVDTFFCLSGFLLATSMAKLKKIPNLFQVIFIRYMRLIIVYAAVIFYICAIYPHTGSGPLWNRAIEGDTVQCRRNWWLNMLMVSNYVDTENICLLISWYIPCDFHFFLITLLLLWIYQKCPCPGKLFFVIITIAAIITPGVVNYIYELPPIQLFTYDFLINPRATKQFHLTYIKSHTRYAANLIGFFSGYIYTYFSSSEQLKRVIQVTLNNLEKSKTNTQNSKKSTVESFRKRNFDTAAKTIKLLNTDLTTRSTNASVVLLVTENAKLKTKKWSVIGAYFGLSIMGVILFTGPVFLWRNYNALESATYAALNRPVFSCGVAMFIICCSLGNVPILKGFLTWYPFVPLSRLTYGVYLIHSILITRNVFVTRNPQHSDLINVLTSSLGIVCQSLIAALVLWLLVEAPIKNLLKICFQRPKNESNENGEQNTGYLHDNLPATATLEVFSSKI